MKNEGYGIAHMVQQDMGSADLAPFKHYRNQKSTF
jgi:hypothetical protein